MRTSPAFMNSNSGMRQHSWIKCVTFWWGVLTYNQLDMVFGNQGVVPISSITSLLDCSGKLVLTTFTFFNLKSFTVHLIYHIPLVILPTILYIRIANWDRLRLSQHATWKYGHHIGRMVMNNDRGSIMPIIMISLCHLTHNICGTTTRAFGHFSKLFWLHF